MKERREMPARWETIMKAIYYLMRLCVFVGKQVPTEGTYMWLGPLLFLIATTFKK